MGARPINFTRYPNGINRDMRECQEHLLKSSPRYKYVVFEHGKRYLITDFHQKYKLAQEILSGDITTGELVLGPEAIYFLKGIKFWKVHEYMMYRN